MTDRTVRWEPINDIGKIDEPFSDISFAYAPTDGRSVTLTMKGQRNLYIRFVGVIALRYEDDCPGINEIPHPWPMIRKGLTYPLLKVEQSQWLEQWLPMRHADLTHFVLLSLNDLVHLIAKPATVVRWETE